MKRFYVGNNALYGQLACKNGVIRVGSIFGREKKVFIYHLNESHLAMVMAEIANIQVGATGRRGKIDSANLQSQTRAEAATQLNVSERSVNTAKKVKQNCIPGIVEAVETGKIKVFDVHLFPG